MLRRSVLALTIAATLATPALAQETRRVRGAIETLDGSTLTVKTREGDDIRIALPEKPVFTAIVPATLADLKPGTYVGSGAMPGPNGSWVAMEVHIFPESMRGTGEGHRPMEGGNTMTNANLETSVGAVDGQMLTLKYKDGEKKILVTPRTAIVAYAPGDRAELKPGIKVVITAQKQADGSWMTPRVSYGRDGLTPPM